VLRTFTTSNSAIVYAAGKDLRKPNIAAYKVIAALMATAAAQTAVRIRSSSDAGREARKVEELSGCTAYSGPVQAGNLTIAAANQAAGGVGFVYLVRTYF